MGLVANEEAIACQGRVGHAHTAGVVHADQLVLFAGFENVRVAGFAQCKDMTAIRPR